MKIVILGKGYLGSTFAEHGFEVLGKDKFNLSYGACLTDQYLNATLGSYEVIVNCLAKSNTRFCEDNYEQAYFSNSVIPAILSGWCLRNNKRFVHISTGCLYDKNNTPQKETDFISAHCNYTLTKWIGEKSCAPNDLIIRPRLFFDDSQRPNNLLNKIKRFEKLSRELDSLSSTNMVVDAVHHLIAKQCYGVFNVACDGYISMQEIGRLMGLEKPAAAMEEVRNQQGLYLVNNIMCLNKLKQFYQPPNIENEILNCLKIF